MKLFSSNNPAGLQPREHRALYVLLRPGYYLFDAGIVHAFALWEGGFLLYGAAAGAMGASALLAKRRGMLISGGEGDTLRASAALLDEFRGGKLGRLTLELPEDIK